jgi:hypothetical protein
LSLIGRKQWTLDRNRTPGIFGQAIDITDDENFFSVRVPSEKTVEERTPLGPSTPPEVWIQSIAGDLMIFLEELLRSDINQRLDVALFVVTQHE